MAARWLLFRYVCHGGLYFGVRVLSICDYNGNVFTNIYLHGVRAQVLGVFNHWSPQFWSPQLEELCNCSFLWPSGVASASTSMPAAAFVFNADMRAVDVLASAIPPRGQELYLHYGRMNNYHLMTRYGFAVPFNQYDSIKIQMDSSMSHSRASSASSVSVLGGRVLSYRALLLACVL